MNILTLILICAIGVSCTVIDHNLSLNQRKLMLNIYVHIAPNFAILH